MAASDIDIEEEDKPDRQFVRWFSTDDIFINASRVINRVHLNPSPSLSSDSEGMV